VRPVLGGTLLILFLKNKNKNIFLKKKLVLGGKHSQNLSA
jgi:hypothetical protein